MNIRNQSKYSTEDELTAEVYIDDEWDSTNVFLP